MSMRGVFSIRNETNFPANNHHHSDDVLRKTFFILLPVTASYTFSKLQDFLTSHENLFQQKWMRNDPHLVKMKIIIKVVARQEKNTNRSPEMSQSFARHV